MYGVFVYHSGSNGDFKMLFFYGRGETKYVGKNSQSREEN